VELNERANIANRNNADLFICIHCNSACVRKKNPSTGKYRDLCNEEAHGAETYVMGLHKSEGNLAVAKRENDAAAFEEDYQTKYNMGLGTDEAEIILAAYQNIYLEQSMTFAQFCQEQFKGKAGRTDKGVKQAGFLVLWKTSMPSVLIETGFLSSPQEERFLGSEKGQTYMAASIFRAFRLWKNQVEGVQKTFDDEIEKMPPYAIAKEDTAGLRKPVNYVLHPNGVKPQVKQDTVALVKTTVDTVKQGPKDTSDKNVKPPVSPATVVYRVQILSSDKPLAQNSPQFKGLDDVWHYVQGGVHKYTSGVYSTKEDAIKRQKELRAKGFSEAFVVVFNKDGQRITLEEAKKLAGN
jgi:N-acetylmuramoyl-L-alanine amidase